MHAFISEGCQLWQHVVTVTFISQLEVANFRVKPKLAYCSLSCIVGENVSPLRWLVASYIRLVGNLRPYAVKTTKVSSQKFNEKIFTLIWKQTGLVDSFA